MKFLNTVYYKLKLMLTDKIFFAAMIAVPLIITITTGYVLRYEKYAVVPIAIADEDGSDFSGLLIERVSKVQGLGVRAAGRADADRMLKDGEIEAEFIINQGFMDNIKNGKTIGLISVYKSPSSNSVEYLMEVVAGEALRFISGEMAVSRVNSMYRKAGIPVNDELYSRVEAYTDSLYNRRPLITVNYSELSGDNSEQSGDNTGLSGASGDKGPLGSNPGGARFSTAAPASAGLVTVFLMFYILFSSSWLVDERTNGTLKRLSAGRGALLSSFAGNIGALFISGSLQLAIFGLICGLDPGMALFRSPLSFAVLGAYLFSVISVSMFLSSILRTSSQLQSAAPVIALMSGFAGGCFWNFAEMPGKAAAIALATPQGWALKALNAVMANPDDISSVILPFFILCTISLILTPLSYIMIRAQVSR